MKYAFIFGSNAFVVPHGVIMYADDETSKVILRVTSIYHDTEPQSFLSVDLDIQDTKGNSIKLTGNKPEGSASFNVKEERDSIKVLGPDGTLIIHIHQIDDVSAMQLQLNITAELEVNSPVAVIRIYGEFMAEDLFIMAENEKLYINEDAYATSALAGSSLRFTPSGVDLLVS